MNKMKLLRGLIFLIAFVVLAWLARQYLDVNPEQIRDYILSFGLWGPLLFMGLYTIGPIVALPTSILSLAAAFAYGIWPGMLYIVIGATGASITGYFIGHFFSDSVIKFQETKWAKSIYERMNEKGFLYVLILRLIPIVGFDILSYLAGMARVKIRSFVPATIIGMLPGTFAYSLVGTSLASGERSLIIIAISVFTALLLITFIFRKKVRSWLNL
ncbi:TVP38/TMEM64 family protein [Halobacillus amylolyticus]|uniref:TVP38/TMEM64 family membrane protein n=1 Tax=Halobacillus amylolyticus TaxID=2932259 RepID=A0ABY4H6H4_9BACI|nr:TVP38/TMEM64 family protein [Halobacillus amylolyticus]UOR10357.1 TVP38/TMEM64 family protein [Halobacillus amylolyticus]